MKKKSTSQKKPFLFDWKLHTKLIFVVLIVLAIIQTPTLFLLDKKVDYLEHKLFLIDNQEILKFTKYSLQEFQAAKGLGGQSMAYIESYLINNKFEDIEIGIGFIEGKKIQNCVINEAQGQMFCEKTVVTFNQRKGIFVTEVKLRIIPSYEVHK